MNLLFEYFTKNRGSQGYRRHIGEGANSLGRARGQSNFPYNFLQKLRNIPVDVLLIFSLNIKDFVFWSFFANSTVIFCYVIER